MDMKTILGLISEAEEYRPLVEGVVKALESYGPEVKKLMKAMIVGSVDIKADAILHLESRGFTREEAIVVVADQWAEMAKRMDNINKKQNN